MAAVTLTDLWIHLASNPSVYVKSFGFMGEDEVDEIGGEVRQYANGVDRIVSTSLKRRELAITLPAVERPDLERLRTFKGKTLFIRDPRSRLEWGTFFALQIPERKAALLPHVSFNFQVLTSYDETV